jgi:hypothetical protein
MAIINSYPTVTPTGSDLIIGTDVSTTPNSTKTFTIDSINALAPQGTVTSVALTETGTALAITGSPITSSGAINIAGAGTSSQVVLGDLSLATLPVDGVTSVALTMPAAFSVAGSPVTSAGTFAVTGAGSNAQLIDGTGALQTIANLPFIDGTGIANRVPFFVDADTISSSGLTYTTTGGGSAGNLPYYFFSGSADIACTRIILSDIFCNNISATGGGTVTLNGNTVIGDTNTDTLTVTAATQFNTTSKHLNNVKSSYGTTPTLEIYSNGTTSFIAETSAATGSNLTIQGNTGISLSGGGASLFSGGGGNDTEISDTNGVTRLALTTSNVVFPSGSVGIGTTSPGAQLEINNPGASSVATFRLQGGVGGSIQFRNNSFPVGTISTNATGTMQFSTGTGSSSGTSSKITILSSGNVGVGTNAPASKLEVDGGDIEVDDSASGLILRSPNGTRYRVKVDNSGNLTTTAV